MRACLYRSCIKVKALVLGLALLVPAAYAQAPPTYTHQVFTVDDGLPTNLLGRDVVQTPDGYLWTASQDGLVRFDGHRFVAFNAGNTGVFTSNRVTGLVVAPDSALWIRTEDWTWVRYRAGRFTRIDDHPGFGGATIHLVLNTGTALWIVTQTGLYRYRHEEVEPLVEGAWNDRISSYHAQLYTRDGALWLGFVESGLRRILDGRVQAFTDRDGLPSNHVQAFHEDAAGTLWIWTSKGLCRYRDGRVTGVAPVADEKHDANILAFQTDVRGDLWKVTDAGVYRYDGLHAVERVEASRLPPLFRLGDLAWNPFAVYTAGDGRLVTSIDKIQGAGRDREGGYWFTTDGGGLHYLRPAPVTAYSVEEGLPERVFYAVAEDTSGALFAGGLASVSRFDGRRFVPVFKPNGGFANLYRDRAGILWFTSVKDRPHRWTGARFEPFSPEHFPRGVRAVWQDRAGTHWFAGDDALYALRDGLWRRYGPEVGLPFVPHTLYETRDGALWMASPEEGVARFENGRFVRLNTTHGLPSNGVRYLYEDDDAVLWLGTYGFGLVRADLGGITTWNDDAFHRAHLTVYGPRVGLFDDVISSIVEDDHGRMWMSTNHGLFWVEKAALNAFAAGETHRLYPISYGVKDGMRNRETNGRTQAAGLKASDGRLWFPTMDGVVVIDPDRVGYAAPVDGILEQVRTGDEAFVPEGGGVALAAAQRTFEVAFTAPSFDAPEQVRFRYRLDGYDADWTETTQRQAAYTKVPGGRYTFEVQAWNRGGRWSEAPSSLQIVVAPYVYETWWFFVLCALAAGLVLAGGVRLRLRRLLRHKQELEALIHARTEALEKALHEEEHARATIARQAAQLAALEQAKSRFFANVSHEFRTPLTLIIGPLQDLRDGRGGTLTSTGREEVDLALRSAHRLQNLIDQILDLAKLEAGHLHLYRTPTDLGAFLDRVALPFAAYAERKKITFVRPDLEERIQVWIDPAQMEHVLTNLLSNAFKFTPTGGTVQLRATAAGEAAGEGVVRIAVQDSGTCIPADELPYVFERFHQVDEMQTRFQPGTGIGLALAKELTELHGGRLGVESTQGSGSTFSVILPVMEDEGKRAGGGTIPAGAGNRAHDPHPAEPVDIAWLAPSTLPDASADGVTPPPDVDQTTVLVVDDNADVRRYIRLHFEPHYRVLEAADGQAALAAVRTDLPDVVIADVMMPEMDGHALCRALRADPETAFIPILMLTARATKADKITGLEGGADAYLTKPFDVQELKAWVESLLNARRRLRQHVLRTARPEATLPGTYAPEEALLASVREVVEEHLSDPDFNVTALVEHLRISRTHLHRQLQALTGQSASVFIRQMRFDRAARLLAEGAGTVSEVAYGVGFKSIAHFSRAFHKHFGCTPTAYAAQHGPAAE